MFDIRLRYLLTSLCFGAIGIFSLLLYPPTVHADLPPRPSTPTPVPTSAPRTSVEGAFIELQIENAPSGAWTVVQWQDGLGGWHDVEGWQGTLDDADSKLWWVAPEDLGSGPFRWQVLTAPEGEVVGLSEAFMLPDEEGVFQTVTVTPVTNLGLVVMN